MLLLLLNYVVLRALWKIDVHLISTLVNKVFIIILTGFDETSHDSTPCNVSVKRQLNNTTKYQQLQRRITKRQNNDPCLAY